MSNVIELTEDNFNITIDSIKPVLIDFYATWCPHCKNLAPRIEQIAKEYEGKILVGKVDIDKQRDLAKQYKVEEIPIIFLFINNNIVERKEGELSIDELDNLIEKYLINI